MMPEELLGEKALDSRVNFQIVERIDSIHFAGTVVYLT